MVGFHFLVDIDKVFRFVPGLMPKWFWFWGGSLIGSMFLFAAGAAYFIQVQKGKTKKELAVRGLRIFALGLLLTGFSVKFVPSGPIWFGILHCIGFSMVLGTWLSSRSLRKLLSLAVLFFILGGVTEGFRLPTQGLVWLGVRGPVSLKMGDYFPVFPWTGMFILGIAYSHFRLSKPIAESSHLRNHSVEQGLGWLSRKSLMIYFIHQPVLIGLMYLFSLISSRN